MDLRLLSREAIEAAKWNGCVHYASNSKIYGYTWYLDNVAEEWMGLVEGDYQSVFPLVFNQKLLGTKQLYLPFLCQQLGLFSVNVCNKERLQYFMNAIPPSFKYQEIAFNDGNKNVLKFADTSIRLTDNYRLDLNQPYERLYDNYSKNIKRNIKKAWKHDFFLNSNLKPEKFVAAVKKAQQEKGVIHPDELYHAAHRIIYNCLHRGKGVIMSAEGTDKQLEAAIFFMFNGMDMINLMNVTTPVGKEKGAMSYLLDAVIQRESNKRKFIDFEGSSVEGIARFYKGFGALNVPYYKYTQNNLPWWLKWRK